MAKAKEFSLDRPAPKIDEEDEDEKTLAAIDEGIRDADAGRTTPIEEVRKRLLKFESPKFRSTSSGRFGMFQRGKALDGLSRFLLSEAQLVQTLQIEPEFRAGAKEMGEAQRCIAGNGTFTVENLGDSVGGHIDLTRQFRRAHAERFEFFGQMFAWMNCNYCHCLLLVIVHNLDVCRAG